MLAELLSSSLTLWPFISRFTDDDDEEEEDEIEELEEIDF